MRRVTVAVILAMAVTTTGALAAAQHRRHHWRYGTASWYYDQGQTASGFHARYGFADCGSGGGPCWPFGTRVRFCRHGRCVTAVADDHGPYVAGRDFDLGQSTAQAIGLTNAGVGTVRYRRLRR